MAEWLQLFGRSWRLSKFRSLKECSRDEFNVIIQRLVKSQYSLCFDTERSPFCWTSQTTIKHANSITWLIKTAGKLPFSALCYKCNSVGLMERKLKVSHFPLYYWVGTTHCDQLTVGHKRSDCEVHHRSSCPPLWSASHQQCGHQTLQLEGTCGSHLLQHPVPEGQLQS